MIHCQKCKHINSPQAEKCAQCGANLLPGEDAAGRLGGMGCAFVLAALVLVFAWVVVPGWTEGGPSLESLIEIGFSLILGPLLALVLVLFGLWWALRKTPLPERYEARAKRHVQLDRKQAIADYSAIVELTSGPGKKAGLINCVDVLVQRGELYKKEGLDAEAKEDWTAALAQIDKDINSSKTPDLALQEKRAKVSHLLEK